MIATSATAAAHSETAARPGPARTPDRETAVETPPLFLSLVVKRWRGTARAGGRGAKQRTIEGVRWKRRRHGGRLAGVWRDDEITNYYTLIMPRMSQ